MKKPAKVMVVDHHHIIRDECMRIFASQSNIQAVETRSANLARDINLMFLPDVIVLDINLPDGNDLNLISTLLADRSEVKIILFSMYKETSFVARALAKGVHAYISKIDDPGTLFSALDNVLANTVYVSPTVAKKLARYNHTKNKIIWRTLSDNENRVLSLLGEGKSLTEIANELAIGYKSVANIVTKIRRKLSISNSSALIKFAVEQRTKF